MTFVVLTSVAPSNDPPSCAYSPASSSFVGSTAAGVGGKNNARVESASRPIIGAGVVGRPPSIIAWSWLSCWEEPLPVPEPVVDRRATCPPDALTVDEGSSRPKNRAAAARLVSSNSFGAADVGNPIARGVPFGDDAAGTLGMFPTNATD